jgi:dTDP-4-amino-4,6-dideoxygalactose transaminase
VLHCGAKPVMVDVGSDFTMDVHQLSLLITEKTKAIIPVDIGGWPCHYDAIFSIIQLPENLKKFSPNNEHQRKLGRILILSDAAHSFGSWYQNRKIGSISDVTVVSLHAVKNITSAEGGVVFINLPAPFDNRQIYQENKIITQNGHSKNVHEKSLADGWKYDIVSLGKKINMTDLGAAIALAQLNKYDDLLKEERFRVFQRYSEKLKEYDWALLPLWEDEHRKSNGHLFMLRVDGITEQQRDQIIHQLKDQEISTNVHFIPLPLFSYFKTIGYDIQHFPRALALYQQEISLPIYPQLSNEMIDFLVNQLILAVQKVQLND